MRIYRNLLFHCNLVYAQYQKSRETPQTLPNTRSQQQWESATHANGPNSTTGKSNIRTQQQGRSAPKLVGRPQLSLAIDPIAI